MRPRPLPSDAEAGPTRARRPGARTAMARGRERLGQVVWISLGLLLPLAGSGAQSGFALDSTGRMVRNGYGTTGLQDTARLLADSAISAPMTDSITLVCPIVETFLGIIGAVAVLRGFVELLRAAKSSGSWVKACSLFLIAWLLVRPGNLLGLFGLRWLLPSTGAWSCLY